MADGETLIGIDRRVADRRPDHARRCTRRRWLNGVRGSDWRPNSWRRSGQTLIRVFHAGQALVRIERLARESLIGCTRRPRRQILIGVAGADDAQETFNERHGFILSRGCRSRRRVRRSCGRGTVWSSPVGYPSHITGRCHRCAGGDGRRPSRHSRSRRRCWRRTRTRDAARDRRAAAAASGGHKFAMVTRACHRRGRDARPRRELPARGVRGGGSANFGENRRNQRRSPKPVGRFTSTVKR
jgi:hypothetical protein